MDHPVAASAIGNLPSAFAAACRLSRNDAELFERCREALVGRFNSIARHLESRREWRNRAMLDELKSMTRELAVLLQLGDE